MEKELLEMKPGIGNACVFFPNQKRHCQVTTRLAHQCVCDIRFRNVNGSNASDK